MTVLRLAPGGWIWMLETKRTYKSFQRLVRRIESHKPKSTDGEMEIDSSMFARMTLSVFDPGPAADGIVDAYFSEGTSPKEVKRRSNRRRYRPGKKGWFF